MDLLVLSLIVLSLLGTLLIGLCYLSLKEHFIKKFLEDELRKKSRKSKIEEESPPEICWNMFNLNEIDKVDRGFYSLSREELANNSSSNFIQSKNIKNLDENWFHLKKEEETTEDLSNNNEEEDILNGILKDFNNVSKLSQLKMSTRHISAPNTPESLRRQEQQLLNRTRTPENLNRMCSERQFPAAKKDKMEFNTQMMLRMHNSSTTMGSHESRPLSFHGKSNELIINSQSTSPLILRKRSIGIGSPQLRKNKEVINRRSLPLGSYSENRFREKFDITNLDTNLPRIDLDAIEKHLKLEREEERKRRSDREEIRRRLALESEDMNEKMNGRKPSLHSRLQSTSDSESPGSDSESRSNTQPASLPYVNGEQHSRSSIEDFHQKQARLQADAREALSQAKDLAKLQMTHERDGRGCSPITEMVRNSLRKVGLTLSPEKRRLTRNLLTEMNVAQLQVIVNDLHTHIEELNEKLVSMLLDRDDLHMEQDSMLVDIEDLTRYLAAKDNSTHQSLPFIPQPKSAILGKK